MSSQIKAEDPKKLSDDVTKGFIWADPSPDFGEQAYFPNFPSKFTICTENDKSLAMVLAAIESARTGRRIPIEL